MFVSFLREKKKDLQWGAQQHYLENEFVHRINIYLIMEPEKNSRVEMVSEEGQQRGEH